jgi:threonine dehydrogenase-like Zn-dependent dehydrogenase
MANYGTPSVAVAEGSGSAQMRLAERLLDLLGAVTAQFGATGSVPERGEAAVERTRDLTRGPGAPAVIEAVGNRESLQTAIFLTRSGGSVSVAGTPHGVRGRVDIRQLLDRNITLRSGITLPALTFKSFSPEYLPRNSTPAPSSTSASTCRVPRMGARRYASAMRLRR